MTGRHVRTAPRADPDPGPGAGTAVEEHPALVRLRLEGTLGDRVRRGVAWSVAGRGLMVVAQLGSQAVLGRLLMPEDYGLVALAVVVNRLAALLSDLGLVTAVVQARRPTERLLSTAFWLSLGVGVAVTAVVVAVAPFVAGFYGEPRLTMVLQVSGLAFAVNVAGVPMALLSRSLQFKRVAALEAVSTVTGLAATIGLALLGVGALSLVIGPLVQVLVMDVMAVAAVRWFPRALPHRAELGQLWRFGRGLTGANLLYFLSRNSDTVLLGKAVDSATLGLYSRSYSIMMLPLQQATLVLSRVLLPAFAEVQDDLGRFRRAWLTMLRTSLLLGLPLGLGVAAASPAFVETLFGTRWLGMVTTLTLLAASVPAQLVARNFGPAYQALGRTGQQFRIALVATVVTLAGIVVGLRWGIDGVAASLLLTSVASMVIGGVPLVRVLGSSWAELWVAVRGILVAGLVMALAAWAAGLPLQALPAPAVLAVQAVTGALVYAALLLLFERDLARAGLARVRRRG